MTITSRFNGMVKEIHRLAICPIGWTVLLTQSLMSPLTQQWEPTLKMTDSQRIWVTFAMHCYGVLFGCGFWAGGVPAAVLSWIALIAALMCWNCLRANNITP